MSGVIYIVGLWVLYRIVVSAIENDRIAKVARIEAELKLKLSERYQDPAVVQRILEARPAPGAGEDDPKGAQAARDARAAAEIRVQTKHSGHGFASVPEEYRKHYVFGLIAFFSGAALIAASYMEPGFQDVRFPALFACALGLGFLTYATAHR